MRIRVVHRGTVAGWSRCAGSLAALGLLVSMVGCGSSATDGVHRPAGRADTAPATSGLPDARLRAYRVVTRVEPAQRAHFALLRTSPEGLPSSTTRILRAPIVGMNWRLAQRIPVGLSGAYWLVPGNRHLCVVDQGSLGNPAVGTECVKTRDALAHGIASVTVKRAVPGNPDGEARLIVGVAPDGARAVEVHTRGKVATVPVVDALFVLRDKTAAPPDRIVPRRRTN